MFFTLLTVGVGVLCLYHIILYKAGAEPVSVMQILKTAIVFSLAITIILGVLELLTKQ